MEFTSTRVHTTCLQMWWKTRLPRWERWSWMPSSITKKEFFQVRGICYWYIIIHIEKQNNFDKKYYEMIYKNKISKEQLYDSVIFFTAILWDMFDSNSGKWDIKQTRMFAILWQYRAWPRVFLVVSIICI